MAKRRVILNVDQLPDPVAANSTLKFIQVGGTMATEKTTILNIDSGSLVFTPSELVEGAIYKIHINAVLVGNVFTDVVTFYLRFDTFGTDLTLGSGTASSSVDATLINFGVIFKVTGATASLRTITFYPIDSSFTQTVNTFNSSHPFIGGFRNNSYTVDCSTNRTIDILASGTGGGPSERIVARIECKKII